MSDDRRFEAVAKPYKGPESYQVEDGPLFYGRKAIAEQLVAKILSSRLTLLHAQSGAGKTSLLNAQVIADLESRGWLPVRVLPHNNPITSARSAIRDYLLPPPEAEIHAARSIVNALTQDEDPALGLLLEQYDALPIRDTRKRALIAPLEFSDLEYVTPYPKLDRSTPYICRLLRSTKNFEDLSLHWDAIAKGEGGILATFPAVTPETRVSELLSRLDDLSFKDAYQRLLTALDTPAPGLLAFLENLVQVYGRRLPRFSIVLLFDQFEEMFTRFVDLGRFAPDAKEGLPDWRLRYELFAELERMHQASDVNNAAAKGVEPLPLRCLISMRSEYTAQLDPLCSFEPGLLSSSFHLKLLTKEEASLAIQQPAQEYGYGYSEECYEEIFSDLTKEEQFIEPAHLQIVCEKLWNTRGRELSQKKDSGNVDLDDYKKLDGAKGIMRDFVHGFLEDLDSKDRLETLEILEQLITSVGTRNIVEISQLVNPPFRSRAHRNRLLSELEKRAIVRVEYRLGSKFAEITHEVLIPSIQEAIRKQLYQDVRYNRLRVALRALHRFQDTEPEKLSEQVLTKQEQGILHEQRENLEWTQRATETMLRAAVEHGASQEVLRDWVSRLADVSPHGKTEASTLVEEYLTAIDPKKRELGLPLLRAIPAEENLARIVTCALCDKDATVRQRAEKEMKALEPLPAATTYRLLQAKLSESTMAKQAYLVLGSLRAAGIKVPPFRLGWVSRIRVAASLFTSLYPHRVIKRGGLRRVQSWLQIFKFYAKLSYVRGIGPILNGTIIGAFALTALMILGILELPRSLTIGLIVGGSFLSLLIAEFAGVRITPTTLHHDRVAGSLVDLFWAGVGALPFLLLPFFISGFSIRVISATFAAVVAARLGVIVACGIVVTPWWRRWAQTMVGWSAALMLMGVTLIAFATQEVLMVFAPLHELSENEFISLLFFFIFFFGLVIVYSTIEAEAATVAFIAGRAGRLASIVTVVTVVVLLLGTLFYHNILISSENSIYELPLETTVESLPFSMRFKNTKSEGIMVELQAGPKWVWPVLKKISDYDFPRYYRLEYSESPQPIWRTEGELLNEYDTFVLEIHPRRWEFVHHVSRRISWIGSAFVGRIPLDPPIKIKIGYPPSRELPDPGSSN